MRTSALAVIDLKPGQSHIVHRLSAASSADPGEGDTAAPLTLTHAEWDADVTIDRAQAFFLRLTGAPYRRRVEIGDGTHIVIMEKNRGQLLDAIRAFLEENYAPTG